MPLKRGNDPDKGPYYRWGNSRKKYYYKAKSEQSRKNAKRQAIIQGYAIEKSIDRSGKPNKLKKSKSTGRKTTLQGVNRKKKSGSKTTRTRKTKSKAKAKAKSKSRSKSRR